MYVHPQTANRAPRTEPDVAKHYTAVLEVLEVREGQPERLAAHVELLATEDDEL